MNKRELKRVFVLLLSIMTALNLLSGAGSIVSASASIVAVNTTTNQSYDDVALALHAAADGETVQLAADAVLTEAITFNRTGVAVTLDLNGHSMVRTVSYAGGESAADGALYVASGTLTIEDTSVDGEGYIEYLNTEGLSGSGLNIGSEGYVKLLSGGIMGTGQSVYAHDAGGRFEMSGGVVYGSGNHPGSEAIAATSGAYITISGGYVGTSHADAAMI